MSYEARIQDQRRTHRKAPPQVIPLLDGLTGQQIGQIGNLSADGLMAITRSAIDEGLVFQVAFSLASAGGETRPFQLGLVCLWCNPASSPGTYWAGFEIIDISEKDAHDLNQIVARF